MKIGLFFGTFNPIHIGHLMIAQAAINLGNLDKIWFIVSPSSPDKDYSKLLHEFDRFDLAFEATRDNPDFKVLDIEFHLPKPSYSYLTLRKLKENFPENEYFILTGEDNFRNIHRWKNSSEIFKNAGFVVYPRNGFDENRLVEPLESNHLFIQAPMLNISSTYIRDLIQQGKSIQYLVPEGCRQHIEKKGFFK